MDLEFELLEELGQFEKGGIIHELHIFEVAGLDGSGVTEDLLDSVFESNVNHQDTCLSFRRADCRRSVQALEYQSFR